MRLGYAVTLMLMLFLAAATVYANAGMYGSADLYSKDPDSGPLGQMMQDEIEGLLDVQADYNNGSITAEQYRTGMEERCSRMTELHKEYMSGTIFR